jgi:hypothetical protein
MPSPAKPAAWSSSSPHRCGGPLIGQCRVEGEPFMSQDNNVICYEGIQRIFRNAIVGFLRSSLCRAYPQNFEEKLRAPFQKEWETIRQNALAARQSGELTVPLADDFDLIGVNHFFHLFDVYYDVFFSDEKIDNVSERKRQKQTLLSWVKTIKNLRDPLSHPAETDFSREDSFILLDAARHVLNRLNLEEDEYKVKS